MSYYIDIQHACDDTPPVSDELLSQWAQLPLTQLGDSAELTLRLVTTDEIKTLNRLYRKMDKTTNVLAFPANLPKDISLTYPLLGDVIICPSVLLQESLEQNKPIDAHWAHIIIHGVLHLMGHDHLEDEDTATMQALEIKFLAELNFENPYQEDDFE